jgi:hypothetical protein
MLFISVLAGESGISTVFSTASKYEISSVDVKVNFSDVRGVSKLVYFYFKEVNSCICIRLTKRKMN